MKSPCKKGCPDRTPTCHSECEKYLSYYEHCRARGKERRKQGDIDGYIKDAVDAHKRRAR